MMINGQCVQTGDSEENLKSLCGYTAR